jgi:hypothetical protein
VIRVGSASASATAAAACAVISAICCAAGGEVRADRSGGGMIRPEHLLTEHQGALVQQATRALPNAPHVHHLDRC